MGVFSYYLACIYFVLREEDVYKRQAMIDIETMKLSRLDTRKNLQTQYLNAVNDLMNNQRNFKKQKDNYLLAEEDVYKRQVVTLP